MQPDSYRFGIVIWIAAISEPVPGYVLVAQDRHQRHFLYLTKHSVANVTGSRQHL